MKNNKVLYIVLGVILFALAGSSVYVNFIADNAEIVSYVLLSQIMLGIVSAIVTMFLCVGKKTYKVLFISFLQVLFVLALVILNTVYGYKNIVNKIDYGEYMEYVSMNLSICLYIVFTAFIGLFSLRQYIKDINDCSE